MIIAIVPARGGSRGLPGKHLRRVGGRSLVELAVTAALEATSVDRVIVSTDDEAIASAGRAAGAEVPFRRPAELAGDKVPTIDVLRHAVGYLEADGAVVDLVVTLQPTSPLRTAAEIDTAVALVRDGSVDSAVSVSLLNLPWSVVAYVVDGRLVRGTQPHADARRQASPPAVRITGSIYVTRRALLDAGLVIGPDAAAVMTHGLSTLDVDDVADLRRAQRARRRIGA